MKIANNPAGFSINSDFETILSSLVQEKWDFVINFRSSKYSAEKGGYRPVEVYIRDNTIMYVTDFTYYGIGEYAELGKGMDWDFRVNEFGSEGDYSDVETQKELWEIYQSNFVSYFRAGAFDDVQVGDNN